MKHTLISCLLFGFISFSNAQSVPNGGFEDWLFRGSFYDPEYWFTYNGDLENGGIAPNITRDTVARTGKYAISLKTVKLPDDNMVAGYITLETELNVKPSSIDGWFKYHGTDDTGFIYSRIFRRIGTEQHLIYEGFSIFTGETDTFKNFSMPYYKKPNGDETPDSCYVYLFSGKKANSELILDDLTFGPLLSVKEPVFVADQIKVYPNPARGRATVSVKLQKPANTTLSVMNLTGSEVLPAQIYTLAAGSQTLPLDLSNLSAGVYLLRLQSASDVHTLQLIIEP